MTNFDYLLSEPQFAPFAEAAVVAEKSFAIDYATCAINCRRAMEFAVKFMYSVDRDLVEPWQKNLVNLMNTTEFLDIVGWDLYRRMDFIRRVGNESVHSNNRKINHEQAMLCLENLFIFLDFVACCYASEYCEREFDKTLQSKVNEPIQDLQNELDLEKLRKENESLRQELTERREKQQQSYKQKPLEFSEFKTRKVYIDTMLQDVGWVEGKDWINEYELEGMPNSSRIGYADYVLLGDNGIPLAVIEAKRTCKDVAVGRQQAKLYADLLEAKYKQRPIIFLSNGFETRIWADKYYPERNVAAIYSKGDLDKEFNKFAHRMPLTNVQVNDKISNRYYQKEAIRAVCEDFDSGNRRKALLVMATGSGKTRTAISIVDVLQRHRWVKNTLFLADRTELVKQAKKNFVKLMPDMSTTNLCDSKADYNARCVFSTYQTMMNCIDEVRDENGGKLYSSGHFDLVICDEAHRSIYNKYKDIFSYFDALLLGLTATPKDEIDKNTYEIFHLTNNEPTYGYDLAQAVDDEYLVRFSVLEDSLKFMDEGITYDELSDEDKKIYEDTFADENGELPESISGTAVNDWVMNYDTIRLALNELMTKGARIDYGNRLGKTIIFAANHRHAEKIYEVFGKEYPQYVGYAKVIDNKTNYAHSAIEEFEKADQLPQIAISVDMLDTGIDVPEVLNLVFFKKVRSKAKFWQMIGRGTRLCEGLLDGKDKECFYIFDFCGNFDFFRVNKNGRAAKMQQTLAEQIFNLKAQIALKLRAPEYQGKELKALRNDLVTYMTDKCLELPRENFAVHQHLKYVEIFSETSAYNNLSYENTLQLQEHVAPLMPPDGGEYSAEKFDALMYGIELAYLIGKTYSRARKDLCKKIASVAKVQNITEIEQKRDFLDKLLHTDYIENAGINEFEKIRETMRDLIKYIQPIERSFYNVNLEDVLTEGEFQEGDMQTDTLDTYKKKVAYYVRTHEDEQCIKKLKTNVPLTKQDITELEHILWSEVGSKSDYNKEYGEMPLGELVRSIIGLDRQAANEAFSKFLDGTRLNSKQTYFVKQIVDYIVKNGMMKEFAVLQNPPFTDQGKVTDLFGSNIAVFEELKKVIKEINHNAEVA